MRRIITVLLAAIMMMTVSTSVASAAPSDGMGAKPDVRCGLTGDRLAVCKSWNTAIALRDQVSSTNMNTRKAAVYAFWAQYEGYPNAPLVKANLIAANAGRSDNCGRVIYDQTMKGINYQYNTSKDSYEGAFWGNLAISAANIVSPQKLGTAISKTVLSKVGQKQASAAAAAINKFTPNPAAAALTQGLKIVKFTNLGQEMNYNKYGAIQSACGIY